MSETAEKPLHVRVAEALGWTDCKKLTFWVGNAPITRIHEYVPEYDTSWEATGPLIEKYGICLVDLSYEDSAEDLDGRMIHSGTVKRWAAVTYLPVVKTDPVRLLIDGDCEEFEYGLTPLIAVCELLLKLSAAGKLKEEAK